MLVMGQGEGAVEYGREWNMQCNSSKIRVVNKGKEVTETTTGKWRRDRCGKGKEEYITSELGLQG